MEQLGNWVKIAVSMLILISLLKNLLPGKKYEKFLNVYLGIMFVIIILSPINKGINISMLLANDYFSENIYVSDDLREKADNIYTNISEAELKDILESQVLSAAIESGLPVDKVRISLSDDCSEKNISVSEIIIVCSEFNYDISTDEFEHKIKEMFDLDNISIIIGEDYDGC